MSMTLADIDGDGDLDLYVVNNKVATVQDLFPPEVLQPSNIYRQTEDGFELLPEWREHYTLGEVQEGMVPRLELAEPDRLYLNDGGGRFTPVPWTEGAFLDEEGRPLESEPLEWGLAARFQDMDGDGDPDLYVCNDFHSPDHIWINDGAGRFRMLAPLAIRSTELRLHGRGLLGCGSGRAHGLLRSGDAEPGAAAAHEADGGGRGRSAVRGAAR